MPIKVEGGSRPLAPSISHSQQPSYPSLRAPDIQETPMGLRPRYIQRALVAPTSTVTVALRFKSDQAVQWRSAIVDNLSDQWVRIQEGGPRFIPPWTWGCVIWLNGDNSLTLDWVAPLGIAQVTPIKSYTPDAGQITASENVWTPNPGINILSMMQTLYNIT